jgi:hypothetical protein
VTRRYRLVAAATGWLTLAAGTVSTLHVGEPDTARWRLLGLVAALWALFAVAAWLVLRVPAGAAVPLVLAGCIGLQALALSVPPRMTDDFLRYAWDGRVQASGTDPYRYAPTAPELSGRRDGWLFPDGRPRLNHPAEHTVYPPVAEAYFLGVHYLSPPGSRHKPWQVASALLAVATSVALVGVLRRTGGDPRLAVLWAWCPTTVLEAGNNAHVDVLGALLAVLGLGWLAAGRKVAAGGALLGAAVAVKLLPALVLPAALRRRPGAVLGGAAVVVLLAYVPHVLAVGSGVAGFLPGYLSEEGYDGTGRFALLRLVLPNGAASVAAVLLLGAAALLAWRGADAGRPWRSALVLTGTAYLVVGPSYPWYALLLVALAALAGRPEWLAVAAAGYPAYFAGALGVRHEAMQQWSYGLALLVVVVVSAARHRRTEPVAAAPGPRTAELARSRR